VSFTQRLDHELAARQVRPSARRRVLLEYSDHIACEPSSEDRLGDPAQLAQTFAAELAADDARHLTRTTFLGLVLAAVALIAGQVGIGQSGAYPGFDHGTSVAIALPAILMILIAPQVALVSGSLAALRAVRRWRARQLPDNEVRLMYRRCSVARAAGLVTCAGLLLYVINFTQLLPAWLLAMQAGLALAAAAVLTLAAVQARRGRRTVAGVAGPAGDIIDDLPPLAPIAAYPRMACVLATIAVGGAGTLLGANAEHSLVEGLERGGLEALVAAFGLTIMLTVTRRYRGTMRGAS
jgi:hypothetical protein